LSRVTAHNDKIGGDTKRVAHAAGFTASWARQTIEFVRQHGPKLAWGLLSVGLFAGLWEFFWYVGVADQRLLPPPHIFLGDFAGQAKNFNTAKRWEIGVDPSSGPTPFGAVVITIASSTLRVLAGLAIAAITSLCMGVLIRYFGLFGKLVLPALTLLAPISPVAWLPLAIFLFGIGNGPAIFMVFIALFFTMTLATITQIDSVNRNYIAVARTMGASKRQIYARVILPAILPGLLVVLRLNLFAAWMVVLIAEATGVGYGLGQIISAARNTFNPELVYLVIVIIGLLGFTFDLGFRLLQRRVLFWLPKGDGEASGG
jgi:NitT/TauT family transport system permease protein